MIRASAKIYYPVCIWTFVGVFPILYFHTRSLWLQECCYDFGDCSICPTCDGDIDRIGNFVCDDDLNNKLCCYDAMDCAEFMWDDVGPLKDESIKLWTNDTSVS